MRLIDLTKGAVALVDDEDYERINAFKWYASGPQFRAARRLHDHEKYPRLLIYMYHQILNVYPQELSRECMMVDHDDRNPCNNMKHNLFIRTAMDNSLNTKRHEDFKGICFDKTHSKYKVYIRVADRERINIGTFQTESEAKAALAEAKLEYAL